MTEDQSSDGTPTPKSNEVTWETFLVKCAPNKIMSISNLAEDVDPGGGTLRTPTIELPCDSEECGGIKYFDCMTTVSWTGRRKLKEEFLIYMQAL